MSFEFYLLVIPFCVMPAFLVSLDYLNRNADIKRINSNIIEFDTYVKRKEEGDAVDHDIAELIDIDRIAA